MKKPSKEVRDFCKYHNDRLPFLRLILDGQITKPLRTIAPYNQDRIDRMAAAQGKTLSALHGLLNAIPESEEAA